MNRNTFFVAALLLAFVALIAHCVAREFTSQAMHRKAARIALAQQQHITYAPDPQSLRLSNIGRVLRIGGLALTLLSVFSMVTALVRRESGWYLLLALLLFLDLVAPMLL